jgi:sugar phosphate isomerase/epimerase
MITYGFNVANQIRFREEHAFAQANGFKILQLWFDRNGLSLHDLDDVIDVHKSSIETILHVVAGVGELVEVLSSAVPLAKSLGHEQIIIHPTNSNSKPSDLHRELMSAGESIELILERNQLTPYFENNSKLENVFQTVENVNSFYSAFDWAGSLLDVAHMDSYEHLQALAKIRMPKFLHIADRHLENVHEHLTLGEGNIDFNRVFRECLNGFEGKAIFEVPWNPAARLTSLQYLKNIEKFLM